MSTIYGCLVAAVHCVGHSAGACRLLTLLPNTSHSSGWAGLHCISWLSQVDGLLSVSTQSAANSCIQCTACVYSMS